MEKFGSPGRTTSKNVVIIVYTVFIAFHILIAHNIGISIEFIVYDSECSENKTPLEWMNFFPKNAFSKESNEKWKWIRKDRREKKKEKANKSWTSLSDEICKWEKVCFCVCVCGWVRVLLKSRLPEKTKNFIQILSKQFSLILFFVLFLLFFFCFGCLRFIWKLKCMKFARSIETNISFYVCVCVAL